MSFEHRSRVDREYELIGSQQRLPLLHMIRLKGVNNGSNQVVEVESVQEVRLYHLVLLLFL